MPIGTVFIFVMFFLTATVVVRKRHQEETMNRVIADEGWAVGCVPPRIPEPPRARRPVVNVPEPAATTEAQQGGHVGCSDGQWDDVPVHGPLSPATSHSFGC